MEEISSSSDMDKPSIRIDLVYTFSRG